MSFCNLIIYNGRKLLGLQRVDQTQIENNDIIKQDTTKEQEMEHPQTSTHFELMQLLVNMQSITQRWAQYVFGWITVWESKPANPSRKQPLKGLVMSFAWKITKITHKVSTLRPVSVKSSKSLDCFLKMTFHTPCPTFPEEIKAEVVKVAQRKSSVCIAFSGRPLKAIWLWSPLFLSCAVSL